MTPNPHIRPARPEDLTAINRLFTLYPYKITQQVVQKIDRDRLEAFFQSGLAGALRSGTPHWVAEESGEILAVAGLHESPWHSEIYGLRMGKIQPWLNTLQTPLGKPLLDAVEAGARAAGCQHLSLRLDGADFPNLHLLEAAGWKLVDVSMKYSRPMPLRQRSFRKPHGCETMTIAPATPADSDWIRRLGSVTHSGTHFLNDPALPAARTHELFARWLSRCIDKLAYRIYVLKTGEGQGLGFVTYLTAEGFGREVGRRPLILDFVLLDPATRGHGLGPWLIEETLREESGAGFDYCELRTSTHNLAAVGCYEKLGFQCCATDFALHKLF